MLSRSNLPKRAAGAEQSHDLQQAQKFITLFTAAYPTRLSRAQPLESQGGPDLPKIWTDRQLFT